MTYEDTKILAMRKQNPETLLLRAIKVEAEAEEG